MAEEMMPKANNIGVSLIFLSGRHIQTYHTLLLLVLVYLSILYFSFSLPAFFSTFPSTFPQPNPCDRTPQLPGIKDSRRLYHPEWAVPRVVRQLQTFDTVDCCPVW
jgi:hypothetical protein